jgi:hypothetical protein
MDTVGDTRRRRRPIALLAFLLAVGSLALLTVGSEAGLASAHRAQSAPPTTVNAQQLLGQYCQQKASDRYAPALQGMQQPDPQQGSTICGSTHRDQFTIHYPKSSSSSVNASVTAAFWGKDVIHADNGKPDLIDGGQDADTVYVDRCDTIMGRTVEHVIHTATKCSVSPSRHPLRATTAPDYASLAPSPTLVCGVTSSGWRINFSPEPTVYAIDSTPKVDWQVVAFQPVLQRQNPETYAWSDYNASTPYLWDITHDQQTPFQGTDSNFWRTFKTGQRTFEWFNIDSPGTYRVEVDTVWYGSNGKIVHDSQPVPDPFHYGPFSSTDGRSCTFPAPPLPTGTYSGTSDEGQAVSLDVEPLFAGVPSQLAWSYVSSLTFTTNVACTPLASAATQWTINPTYMMIKANGTFTYSASLSYPTNGTELNIKTTAFVTGQIDSGGHATGTVQLAKISYDLNSAHYDCTGQPHTFSAHL